jgi:hypothetical protein
MKVQITNNLSFKDMQVTFPYGKDQVMKDLKTKLDTQDGVVMEKQESFMADMSSTYNIIGLAKDKETALITKLNGLGCRAYSITTQENTSNQFDDIF